MKPTDLSECQEQIKDAMEKLRGVLEFAASIDRPVSSPDRESTDADICLASRSAYFDFYTWVVLNGVVDAAAKRDLDGLFQLSLKLMGPSEFKESVVARYKEFKCECEQVLENTSAFAAASSIT